MSLLYKKFEKILADFPIRSLDQVAVAVSGGADSMCLVYLLRQFFLQQGTQITALIVNHNLRENSKEEALIVKELLHKIGIKGVILEWVHDGVTSNIQAKARKFRYKLLCEYCLNNEIKHLFIGHHKNDQAETILLNIIRGTGLDGLNGMSCASEINNINVIRPLLSFGKHEIKEYLEKNNIKWIEDPSNLDEKYGRVKVRKIMHKFDEKILDKFLLLSENAKRATDFIDGFVDSVFDEICKIGDLGEIVVRKSELLKLDEEILFRMFNKIFRYVNNQNLYPSRLDSLKNLSACLKNGMNFAATSSKVRVVEFQDDVLFFKERKFIEEDKRMSEKDVLWDGRYKVSVMNFFGSEKFYIGRLTKIMWSRLKRHVNYQGYKELLFSMPVIFNEERSMVICPFLDICVTDEAFDLRFKIEHIRSGRIVYFKQ